MTDFIEGIGEIQGHIVTPILIEAPLRGKAHAAESALMGIAGGLSLQGVMALIPDGIVHKQSAELERGMRGFLDFIVWFGKNRAGNQCGHH